MTRKEANDLILQNLKEYLDKNIDARFIQALFALNIIKAQTLYELFYEEPSITLLVVEERVREINEVI